MARAASDIASGRKAVGCLIDGKFIWEPPVIASVKYFLSEYHYTFLCQVLCIKMPRLRPRGGKGVSPRGPISGFDPLTAPVLYAFQQAREDLARYTEGLTLEQIWAAPPGFGSVGFHLRHIAGSTGRLMTYLEGGALSQAQMEALATEKDPAGAGRHELLAQLDRAFRAPWDANACPPPSSAC